MPGITDREYYTNSNHVPVYYKCSESCGAPVVKMEDVDNAALEYLRSILNDETQKQITAALREYDGNEKDSRETFLAAKKKKIREKQTEYDNLMKNLSTGAFTGKVADDICKRMEEIQETIRVLEMAEPPKDYTSDEIRSWMGSIRKAPSEKAVKLLIARIEAQKVPTAFNIESTLKAVGGKVGCGSDIAILPPTLFRYFFKVCV